MAKNEGIDLKLVLNEFSDVMSQSNFLIAHNMSFDLNVVGAEFLREKIDSRIFKIPKICTMEKSTDYCKISSNYGYKWPSLSEKHLKLFNTDFKDAHDADIDVRVCAKCFFGLKEKGILK